MQTEQRTFETYKETEKREEPFSGWPSCPGYVYRSNAAGFQWRQACSCCPHPNFPSLQAD